MRVTRSRAFALVLVANPIFTLVANANIIGVDFYLSSSTNQTPSSTASVGPVASTGWNNLIDLNNTPYIAPLAPSYSSPNPLILTDNIGATTTGKIGFTQGGVGALDGTSPYAPYYGAIGSANSSLSPNQQLYNGATQSSPDGSNGITPGGHSQEVTIQNIPYAQYSVYLLVGVVGSPLPPNGYGLPGNGSVQIFHGSTTAGAGTTYYFKNIDGSSIPDDPVVFTQATGMTLATATSGANYVLFDSLTGGMGTSETFDIDSYASDQNHGAYFSGLEIVDTSVAPEPGTISFACVGGLGLLLRRRANRGSRIGTR